MFLRRLGRALVRKPLKKLVGTQDIDKLNVKVDGLEQALANVNLQKLRAMYPPNRRSGQREVFRDYEAKVFSQNGEDGLLLYIFSKIGTTSKRFVEIGIEDGRECNMANLTINWGWSGDMIDCDWPNVLRAREYYAVLAPQVQVAQCFVTAENINAVLPKGSVDLLSIDIDGNDYWVWKAITTVDSRVVVIEYNAVLGADKSLTVAYDPTFERYKKHRSGYYHGVSLSALAKLAGLKGYGLVGCESSGVNAFFVKRSLLGVGLKEVSVAEAYYPHMRRLKKESLPQQFNRVKHLPWVAV